MPQDALREGGRDEARGDEMRGEGEGEESGVILPETLVQNAAAGGNPI